MPQSAARRRELHPANKEKISNSNREYRRRRRLKLIAALGGECTCPRCDVKEPKFLTIDHINGLPEHHKHPTRRRRGDVDRLLWKEYGEDPERFYREYRLLCANCHMATKGGEICPHLKE
jgi:hypothetical protein